MTIHQFDDIVVGAGAAGVPLAVRLSEDPERQVALIEAGPHYRSTADTPADLLDGNVMSLTLHDWRSSACAVPGRQIRFPRGRVVGGGSAVGNTVALRAVPEDFDAWAACGNPDWSWANVLAYFRKLEDDLDFGGDYHGAGGPIPIRRFRPGEMTVLQSAFLASCLEANFPWADDHNHPEAHGVGLMPSNRRDVHTRVSTATGYLPSALGRPNLSILSAVLVDRVLIRDGRAYGVALRIGTETHHVIGRRVILAAGAIGTPSILLRSGVGPAEDLRRLGIPVVVGLTGVGAGLVDHPRTGVFLTHWRHAAPQTGPNAQTVLRTTSQGSCEANNMHLYMVNNFDLSRQFPQLRQVDGADRIFGVMVVAQRPHSVGRVSLASADPYEPPVINLGYLSDERDCRMLADGVRTAWHLMNSPLIRRHGDRFAVIDEATVASEDALAAYVRSTVDSTYNPVGTAKMGPGDDLEAVVDQSGAVYGVDGLHVADASIMPTQIRANTNLTSIMIGERIADMLKARQ